MKHWRILGKFLFRIVIGLAIILALLAILQWQLQIVTDSAKAYLDHALKGKATVEYTELSGSLINSVKIKKLKITTKSGLTISAGYLQLNYRLLPLLKNKVEISRAIIDHLQIELPQPAPAKQPEQPFSVDSLLTYLQQHYLPKQLLGNLPFFDIKNFQLTASAIRVKKQPLTFTNIRLDLARLRLKPNAIFMMLTNLSGKWQERNLQLKNLAFVLRGNTDGINLNQGELHTANSSLSFNALLDPTSGLNLNLTQFYVDLNEFTHQANIALFKKGFIKGEIALSGVPVHFGLQANLQAQLDWRKIKKFSIKGRYDRGEVFLDAWQVQSNAGNLDGHAYWNQQKRIIGKLHFSDVNLRIIQPSLPSTRLNGNLNVNASNLYLKHLTGFGALQLYHSFIDTIAIDTVRLNMTASGGFLKFTKPSFIQIDDSSRFYLTGAMDPRQNIDFSLLTFDNHLNHLLRDFGGQNVHGKFDGRIHLYGPLRNPNFSGNLFLPGFNYENINLDSLKFNVFIEGLSKERRGDGTFEIVSGRFGNFPVDQVSFRLRTKKNLVYIQNLQFLSKKNFFKTSILAHWSADSMSIFAFPFQIQYENYWIKAKDTLWATLNSHEAVLEGWEFSGPHGSALTIDGFYDFDAGDLQTFLSLKKVQIAPFEQISKTNLDLGGSLNGYAEIITPFTDPNFEVDLKLDSLRMHNVPLGNLTSKWRFANEQLSIDSLELSNKSSMIEAHGTFNLRLSGRDFNLIKDTNADFVLEWRDFNLRQYAKLFKGLYRLQGISEGQLTIKGLVNNPTIHSEMQLNKFAVDQFTGDSLRMNAHYANNQIRLDHFSVVLDSSHISANGWQKYQLALTGSQDNIMNEPFELHVLSQDKQLLFLGNLNNVVESVQGPYLIDLTLGGTPAKPAIKSGSIQLDDGEVLLSMIRDPIKHVQFKAGIENSIFNIEHFSAQSLEEKDFWQKSWAFLTSFLPWGKPKLKEGTMTLSGAIDLSDLSKPNIDLSVKLNHFYADYFIQNISAVASTDNLTIQGQDTILVQGDLYIHKGVFEVDLNQIARNTYLSEGVSTPGPPYTALNLHLQIPGNFVVTSSPLDLTNNFRVTFMGDLQITMQPPSTEPHILGHLEATNGKYASWNQNFVVENANIDFKNNPTINPDIDFKAFKIVGNKTFELSITGNLNNLHQEIRVLENGQELNMSYLDKIALLTLGADISTLQSNADSTLRNVGENIATTSILTAVERGAERFTGLDKVEINSNKSLIDLNRLRLNNGLSDASIAFGKYLTSDLYVEYRTQFGSGIPAPRLSWDAGNRIGLQYRINRYWTLDSYYEKTNRGNTRIKFGLNWEYSF